MIPSVRPRAVCVTADDYGMSRGTNEAIEQLASRGKLTAVSVLAHGGADLASLDRLVATGVSIGLHLAYTDGIALVDSGRRELPRNARAFVIQMLRAPSSIANAMAEARAQAARLRRVVGPIAFVNGHEHLHVLPLLWPLTLTLSRELGARYVRTAHTQRIRPDAAGLVALASKLGAAVYPVGELRELNPLGIGHAGEVDAARVHDLLRDDRSERDGAIPELCMHPALDLGAARRREFDFIGSGGLDATLESCSRLRARSLASVASHEPAA